MKRIIFLIYLFGTWTYGQQNTYTNPVSGGINAADPSVLLDEGVYYMYATSAGDGFKYWTSTNLSDWKEQGYAFK
jgi:hypothetical protein